MLSQEDIEKLRRLMELREARDEAKRVEKDAEAAYREAEGELHALLTDGPVDRLNNVDLGPPWGKVSFHAKSTIYGKIVDEDEAAEHFRAHGGLDEISKPKFVKQRINEIVREVVETGEEDMPPGLSYYRRPYVQITRQKG